MFRLIKLCDILTIGDEHMKESIFINQAFTTSIKTYIDNKETPENPILFSFPVMVIRTLIAIYGELDIINPYRTNNEDRMGGFDSNLTKFGFSNKLLKDFKISFQKYYETKNNNLKPNIYFLKIEKYLMDMFFYRQRAINMTNDQLIAFQAYLYLSNTKNAYMKQELEQNVTDIYELDTYYRSKLFEASHRFALLPYQKNILIPEAYTLLGYTLEMIAQLDNSTLEQLNNKILNFFKINPDDPEKMDRLREAIIYHQRYGAPISSGNGYVDMLLLLSVIATIMMTLFAITVRVLG